MKTKPCGPRARAPRARHAPLPFLLALAACSPEPNWVGAPRVPSPVLLGPVDRVGGHRSGADAKAVGQFGTSVDATVSVSTSETRVGSRVYVNTETKVTREGTAKLSANVLRATEGDAGRDARVQSVGASALFWYYGGTGYSNLSVDVDGDVVRATGGGR